MQVSSCSSWLNSWFFIGENSDETVVSFGSNFILIFCCFSRLSIALNIDWFLWGFFQNLSDGSVWVYALLTLSGRDLFLFYYNHFQTKTVDLIMKMDFVIGFLLQYQTFIFSIKVWFITDDWNLILVFLHFYGDFDCFHIVGEFFRIYHIHFCSIFRINRIHHTQCNDNAFQQLGLLCINHKSSHDGSRERFAVRYFVNFFLVILKKRFWFKFG